MKVTFLLKSPPDKADGRKQAPVEYVQIEHSQSGRTDTVVRRASGADKVTFPAEYAAFKALEAAPAAPAPVAVEAPTPGLSGLERLSKKLRGK